MRIVKIWKSISSCAKACIMLCVIYPYLLYYCMLLQIRYTCRGLFFVGVVASGGLGSLSPPPPSAPLAGQISIKSSQASTFLLGSAVIFLVFISVYVADTMFHLLSKMYCCTILAYTLRGGMEGVYAANIMNIYIYIYITVSRHLSMPDFYNCMVVVPVWSLEV